MKSTKPQPGFCESCRTKTIVRKELLVEREEDWDNRTEGKFDSERLRHAVCRQCFILPEEEFEWDDEGQYRDLNLREAIWDSGYWDAEPYYYDKPRITRGG